MLRPLLPCRKRQVSLPNMWTDLCQGKMRCVLARNQNYPNSWHNRAELGQFTVAYLANKTPTIQCTSNAKEQTCTVQHSRDFQHKDSKSCYLFGFCQTVKLWSWRWRPVKEEDIFSFWEACAQPGPLRSRHFGSFGKLHPRHWGMERWLFGGGWESRAAGSTCVLEKPGKTKIIHWNRDTSQRDRKVWAAERHGIQTDFSLIGLLLLEKHAAI